MPDEKDERGETPMTAEQRERVEDPNQIDETVPGGKYILGDQYVDANNQVIGKVAKADLKVDAAPEQTDETDAVAQRTATTRPTTKKGR